jgi:hypothetical protein
MVDKNVSDNGWCKQALISFQNNWGLLWQTGNIIPGIQNLIFLQNVRGLVVLCLYLLASF